jgi:hypothetical protein
MNPSPVRTDKQLKIYETLARIRMAQVAFYFTLALFLAAFVLFVIALFGGKNLTATTILGVIDGILGWALKTVYAYLFPTPK